MIKGISTYCYKWQFDFRFLDSVSFLIHIRQELGLCKNWIKKLLNFIRSKS